MLENEWKKKLEHRNENIYTYYLFVNTSSKTLALLCFQQ